MSCRSSWAHLPGYKLPRPRLWGSAESAACCRRAPRLRGAGRLRLLPIWGHCLSLPEGHLPPASHCPLAVSCWPKPRPAFSLFISLLVVAPGRTQGAGILLRSSPALESLASSPWTLPSPQCQPQHTRCVHGRTTHWAGPRVTLVPLLALAQAPPLHQPSPTLHESEPDGNEAGVLHGHSRDIFREPGDKRTSSALTLQGRVTEVCL